MSAVAFTEYEPFVPVPAMGDVARQIKGAEWRAKVDTQRNRAVPPPFDCLDDEIAYEISQRWRQPCEAAFEFLVARNSRQLARLIDSATLRPADLTFAAEILGRAADSNLVRSTLVPLLRHNEAVVREGAIYGVAGHLDEATRVVLRRMAETDRSAAVRTAAEGALEG